MTIEETKPDQPKRRSPAWMYYTALALLSFIYLCLGHVSGVIPLVLFGAYARRIQWLLIASIMVVVLAGCGGSKGQPGGDGSAAVSSTYTVTATSSSVSEPSMPSEAELELKSTSGYTATATLRRGSLEKADYQQNGTLRLGSSCSVNPETDAVIPFQISVTNTTPNFSASPSIEVVIDGPNDSLPTKVSAEIGYSEGPQCVNTLAFSPTDPLKPGASTYASGFFIASNYYSPAHPNGEPGLLKNAVLIVKPAFGSEDFAVAGTKGMLHSQHVPNGVPFVPGGNGGCLVHEPCPPPFKVPNVW